MDDRYETFCMASPLFYDVLHSSPGAAKSAFKIADRELPDGWERHEQNDWYVFRSGSQQLPLQGWKIHVSACLENSERVLDAVWDYCMPRGINFKFLRSPGALLGRVSKYAPRGYSGKLVTIYPINDGVCETILRELGEILEGEPGPYILSDLRWGSGPMFVRYGAFVSRYCVGPNGQVLAAIADDTGTLVPDRRNPVFYVPPWVTVPDFLAPHLAARNAVSFGDQPYDIERVLHFSNGGGIYVARDKRTGEEVVLKEGRPHAGLDSFGHDAVRRVEREYEMLRHLEGVHGVPKVYDLFWVGEHRFLAMEFVDGVPLSKAIVRRFPLIEPTAGAAEAAEYTEWALNVYSQVEATLDGIHERGLVYGDLHLFNVMVREDGTTSMLDFEVATPVEEATRPGLGNQGFSPPRGTTGMDVDRYGLACLQVALFLPMTNILWLHRPKVRHHAEVIAEHFPVPPDYLTRAVDVIAPDQPAPPPLPEEWPAMRDALAKAIVASATPEREDRLFPGDIQQFTVGGLGLAYGAAGVLYALDVTGAGRYPELEEWLVNRVREPAIGTLPGLYNGLHGAAFALDHLGYRQEALDAVDKCLREAWQGLGLDLHGGLAGVGLNLLHLADRTGEPGLLLAGHRAAELVVERLGTVDSVPEVSGKDNPFAGLLRGSSGPALLLLRMYDDTGDSAYLDAAAVALRQDLRRCVVRDNGAMHVNEGWRTLPYLDVGSAGIGLVLEEFLTRRHEDDFAEAVRAIHVAQQSRLYILPALFNGRAGILYSLASRGFPATDPLVVRQIRGLSWQALPYEGGIAFPGAALMRLSMDLASGTAGVLLALGAALHDEPVRAPLFPSGRLESAPQSPAPTGAGEVSLNL